MVTDIGVEAMAPMKKGTPTEFRDRTGKIIRVGDRIRNVLDGHVMHIDKFGGAAGPAGVRYRLKDLDLSRYELYAGPMPEIPSEAVVTADDVACLAPAHMRDPERRTVRKKAAKPVKKNKEEEESVGETVSAAKLALGAYALCRRLENRAKSMIREGEDILAAIELLKKL